MTEAELNKLKNLARFFRVTADAHEKNMENAPFVRDELRGCALAYRQACTDVENLIGEIEKKSAPDPAP